MPRTNSTDAPKSTCTSPLKYLRAAHRIHEHSEVLSWQTDCMTASSRKPKFHLNTNAGIVLTLQCRVFTLPPSAQPPYKFPSLLLQPHIPKPSLAGNYMHFNTDNKQDLTSKYSAAVGFEIWTSNAFISRLYPITDFFTRSFKIVCPFCKATKRITEECEISINIGSQKLSQLEKNIQYIYLFKRRKIGKILKKVFWKKKFLPSQLHKWKPKSVRVATSSCTGIMKRKLYRINISPVLIMQLWEFIPHIQIQILIWERIQFVTDYLCWCFMNTKSPCTGELPSSTVGKEHSWNVMCFANPRMRKIPFRVTGHVSAVFRLQYTAKLLEPSRRVMQLTPSGSTPLLFLQFSTTSGQQNNIQLYDISRHDFHPSDPSCHCSVPLCLQSPQISLMGISCAWTVP